jgi:DNA-binding PadR family transcriptional regulator
VQRFAYYVILSSVHRKDTDLGRFSDPGLLILASLSAGPRHGYAMMQDIAAFSGTTLEPGTLYGAIGRLERLGWIVPLEASDRRRPYEITAAGQATLAAQLSALERIVDTGRGRLSAARAHKPR